jgi:O-6-methylguanine DNA methyltransferase
MASLNDNLFTNGGAAFGFRSRFGTLCVRYTARGLAEVSYGEAGFNVEPIPGRDGRRAFQGWLAQFEGADPAARWDLLDLQGSVFQRLVWRRLVEIPIGEVRSYGEIAEAVGRPRAGRAVGSAVGANPVAVLIPCHRVLPKGGGIGSYRWGGERKRALLDAERESGSALGRLIDESPDCE